MMMTLVTVVLKEIGGSISGCRNIFLILEVDKNDLHQATLGWGIGPGLSKQIRVLLVYQSLCYWLFFATVGIEVVLWKKKTTNNKISLLK